MESNQTRYVVSLLFKKYTLGATTYNESLRTDIIPAVSGEEAFGIFYDQCRKSLGSGYDLVMKSIVPVIEVGIVATLEQTEVDNTEVDNTECILLNKHEIESKFNRQQYAEGLIEQLPINHEGRNFWLLNYGRGPQGSELRKNKVVEWDTVTESAKL